MLMSIVNQTLSVIKKYHSASTNYYSASRLSFNASTENNNSSAVCFNDFDQLYSASVSVKNITSIRELTSPLVHLHSILALLLYLTTLLPKILALWHSILVLMPFVLAFTHNRKSENLPKQLSDILISETQNFTSQKHFTVQTMS